MRLVYFILLFSFLACNSLDSEQKLKQESKQERLKHLMEEKVRLSESINTIKSSLDSSQNDIPLVNSINIQPKLFQHFIHLQASIESNKAIVVMPALGPAKVQKIFVKLGDYVSREQVLLKLDDTLISGKINALNTKLLLAREILKKQQLLWEQKIGSELELKQRQNEVEYLEAEIESLTRNRDFSLVRSPVSGVIDILDLHEGDIFSGYLGNNAQLRILNLKELKATILVPDIYMRDLKVGTKLQLSFTDAGLNINSHIQNISKYIDKITRTFTIQAPIVANPNIKINMIGSAKILDYQNPHGKVLPIDLILSDQLGKYVLVLEKTPNDHSYTLTKRRIILGKYYQNTVEINNGLNFGDLVLNENINEFISGMKVRIN